MNGESSIQPMWGTLGARGLDETPLCLHCLARLRPDAHFCKRCMAPVSSYAAWGYLGDGNYESIWSTAWILNQATVTRAPTRLHVLVILLVFGPQLLGSAGLLILGDLWSAPLLGSFVLVLQCAWLYVSAVFIWRTCSNYRSTPALTEDD